MLHSYQDTEIVVHHITALVGDDKASWFIGRRLDEPITTDELQSVQELVYYPCDWDTAEQVYNFMVREYKVKQDAWWNTNSGALIYLCRLKLCRPKKI